MQPLNMRRFSKIADCHIEDLEFMYKTRSNPLVDKWLNGDPPGDYLEHVKYIYSKSEHDKAFFVFENQNNERVGYCQINSIPPHEAGWVISPEFQGFGNGRQAVELLLKEMKRWKAVFDTPNKIVLYVQTDNVKAFELYKSVGFVTQGVTDDKKLFYMEFDNNVET